MKFTEFTIQLRPNSLSAAGHRENFPLICPNHAEGGENVTSSVLSGPVTIFLSEEHAQVGERHS